MKNLNKYLKFETEKFLDGKQLVFLKGKMMDNENFKGISMTVLVLNDPTNENTGEEFIVKVKNGDVNFLNNLKPLTPIRLTNISKTSVYGEYKNQLSIHANVSVIGK